MERISSKFRLYKSYKKKSYIWKNDWLWPYESTWGFIEKFKYINVLTGVDLQKVFNFRGQSFSIQEEKELISYRKTVFNDSLILNFFNITETHYQTFDCLKYNNMQDYIHTELYYCPKCIKYAYHSYYHQLTFMDECIFHHVKLKQVQKNINLDVQYVIENNGFEAYKIGYDTTKCTFNKYFDVLPASKLIVKHFSQNKEFKIINKHLYRNIRFINPVNSYNNAINRTTLNLLNKIFKCEEFNRIPIFKITYNKCKNESEKLSERVRLWKIKKYQNYNRNQVPGWYVADLINDYIRLLDYDIIDNTMVILHNFMNYKDRDINELDFRYAAAIIVLAYLITGSRDVYEGIKHTLMHYEPIDYKLNCNISYSNILSKKIDDKEYSEFINYLIYSRIVHIMYKSIVEVFNNCDITEISYSYDFSDKIVIPNYLILEHNDTYEIFECPN